MNDMLEKKIREHAEAVFGSEPAAGHRERFAGKLAARRKRRTTLLRRITACVTAAAAIVAAVFLLKTGFEYGDGQDEESFDDVRNYYAMLLEDEIESTEQLLPALDNGYREDIRRDIASIRAETAFAEYGERNEILLVRVYSSKIEALQHIRNIISEHL
ncbi:MAG: hypothetical protein LBP64_05115 [Tannerella sp.]|jgi:hypothetical protein|nr:hypothetical protein [Tannerella sp.]